MVWERLVLFTFFVLAMAQLLLLVGFPNRKEGMKMKCLEETDFRIKTTDFNIACDTDCQIHSVVMKSLPRLLAIFASIRRKTGKTYKDIGQDLRIEANTIHDLPDVVSIWLNQIADNSPNFTSFSVLQNRSDYKNVPDEVFLELKKYEACSSREYKIWFIWVPTFLFAPVILVILCIKICQKRLKRKDTNGEHQRLLEDKNDEETARTPTVSEQTIVKEHMQYESISKKHIFKKDTDGTLTRPHVLTIAKYMESVGMLYVGPHSSGTVVRVGCMYIVTAWHVVEGIVYPAHATSMLSTPPDATCLVKSNIYIDFCGDRVQTSEKNIFKLLPEIVFWDRELDIAILVLDTTEKKEYLPEPFERIWRKLVGIQSKSVHVLAQHPNVSAVVNDQGCKIIRMDDKKVVKAKKWFKTNKEKLKKCRKRKGLDTNCVDSALFDINDHRRIIIDTYLGKGASGGAIVEFDSDQTLGLVAILTHGIPPPYYDETDMKIPEEICMEVGTTMNAIKHAMQIENVDKGIIDSIFSYPVPKVIAAVPMDAS